MKNVVVLIGLVCVIIAVYAIAPASQGVVCEVEDPYDCTEECDTCVFRPQQMPVDSIEVDNWADFLWYCAIGYIVTYGEPDLPGQ